MPAHTDPFSLTPPLDVTDVAHKEWWDPARPLKRSTSSPDRLQSLNELVEADHGSIFGAMQLRNVAKNMGMQRTTWGCLGPSGWEDLP